MRPTACPLPPSSSLPPLRRLNDAREDHVFAVLANLSAIYRPVVASVAQKLGPRGKQQPPHAASFVDSGYTSATEDGDDDDDGDDSLDALRADDFERSVAERWLTGFIARVEELECFTDEDARSRALEEASCVLESFYATPTAEDSQDGEYAREFSFQLSMPGKAPVPIEVRLNDGLAGTNSADPDDVGLQSWSASIVLSDLLCASPERFGLGSSSHGNPSSRIIELGAGTGLVGLVLGTMLPHLDMGGSKVIATDYHPTVLVNLRANVATNFRVGDTAPVEVCLLDWASPSLEAPLDVPADMLIATDVVYAPEHAVWLRDCATKLLAPTGVFWLLITVRQKGRFEDVHVCETVEAAFAAEEKPRNAEGRVLSILRAERLEKRDGLGRGDESGYQLFMIGWEDAT